jgi:hypothetical protein
MMLQRNEKIDNVQYGKDKNWVVYNSTFGKGIKVGHMYGIAHCMRSLVKPNDYKGLLIGIGMPDRNLPEKDMRLATVDKDYDAFYDDMAARFSDPSQVPTFFRRLYELDLALRGNLPMGSRMKEILADADIGYEPVPFDKVLAVPKHSHVIYPWHYDSFFKKDKGGQFEPPKSDIAVQYIFMGDERGGSDGWTAGRIRKKSAEERNIPVSVVYESGLPPNVKRLRPRSVISERRANEVRRMAEESVFDVAFMPYAPFDLGQVNLVSETLNAAEKKGTEVVFAVPYLPIPRRAEDYGAPFNMSLDLRDYLAGEFKTTPEQLHKVHITFLETDNEGRVDVTARNRAYLPKEFIPHRYRSMFARIPEMSEIPLEDLGLSHVRRFARQESMR